MSNSQVFAVEGVVLENLPNTMFRIKLEDRKLPEMEGKTVLCHLAGKMRLNYVRLLPGDRVRCEINSMDTTLGRITYKLK